MKRFSVALGVFALVLWAQVSKADTFSFNFTGPIYSGSGTFTATNEGSGPLGSTEWDVTGFTSGSVTNWLNQTSNITGISTFNGADNVVYAPGILGIYNLDDKGISFLLANGVKINLSANAVTYVAQGSTILSTENVSFNLANITNPKGDSTTPSVPEPSTLALLGTGILGAAGAIRRRLTV
jgi:PEP-CTERM motif